MPTDLDLAAELDAEVSRQVEAMREHLDALFDAPEEVIVLMEAEVRRDLARANVKRGLLTMALARIREREGDRAD